MDGDSLESAVSTCTTTALSGFSLASFTDSVGENDVVKSSFDAVNANCFSQAISRQDESSLDVPRSVMTVDVVSYVPAVVTTTAQDNLLCNSNTLCLPDSGMFEVQTSSGVTVTMAPQTLTLPHHCLQPEQQQDGEQKIKRKGGWPKGKKRKKELIDICRPKAPVTGYVRFLNSHREEVKRQHPDLPFPEVTKLLGGRWSALPAEEKQKYLDEAEEDKKRYISELKTYQQTEAYQAFVKRQTAKKMKQLCGDINPDELESSILLADFEEEDPNDLFCRTCNQYFSSYHNKREHMFGRSHLLMLTGEFEREAETTTPNNAVNNVADPPVQTGSTDFDNSLSISQFTEEFLEKNLNREIELRELQKSLLMLQEQNVNLTNQITDLKDVLQKVESDLTEVKNYSNTLHSQIDSLRMVPLLFGVMTF